MGEQVKSENGKNYIFGTPVGQNICESMTSYAFGYLKHNEILKERAKRAAEGASDECIHQRVARLCILSRGQGLISLCRVLHSGRYRRGRGEGVR
jgi:hypothetical protein